MIDPASHRTVASISFSPAALTRVVLAVVQQGGSAPEEAALVADNLVLANASGHASHGVGMLPRYIDSLLEGGLLPNQHVQVALEGSLLGPDGPTASAVETIREAAKMGAQHSLVMVADERTTDSVVLRLVEQANAASDKTMIVVHPATGTPVDRDRRWTVLLERCMALHGDVQLALRLPPPTGMR